MTWLPPLWLRWAFTYVPPEDPRTVGVWFCRTCGEKLLSHFGDDGFEYCDYGCHCGPLREMALIKIGIATPGGDLVFTPWYWIRRVLSL